MSDQSSPSGLSAAACNDLLCTPDEVYFYLSSLDPSMVTGPDGISARMLRQTADSITTSVTELLNLSLRSGCVPKEWKKSNVVPIPKTSPPSAPSNYRPISLLSILSKVMERHVHLFITEHLRDHHPLSDSQWGFQAGKSTETGLLATVHSWLNILEQRQEVGAVFFDLRKAFDSVPHARLMAKLQQIGLNDHILAWIGDYLTGREQRVTVNGSTSQYSVVPSGIPQGSVLGPLLFLIYVDDLARIPLSASSEAVLYADDLLLFRPIHVIEDSLSTA